MTRTQQFSIDATTGKPHSDKVITQNIGCGLPIAYCPFCRKALQR